MTNEEIFNSSPTAKKLSDFERKIVLSLMQEARLYGYRDGMSKGKEIFDDTLKTVFHT